MRHWVFSCNLTFTWSAKRPGFVKHCPKFLKISFVFFLNSSHFCTMAVCQTRLDKNPIAFAMVHNAKMWGFQENYLFIYIRNFRQYLTNPGRFALHVKVKFHEKTHCLIYFLEDYNLASKRVMFFVSQNDFKTENRKQVPHHEQWFLLSKIFGRHIHGVLKKQGKYMKS